MTQLNEIKRMQLLAGILTESQLSETKQFSIPDILNGKHTQSNNPLNTIEDYKPGMKVVAHKFYGNKEELNQSYGTVTGMSGGKVQIKRADGDASFDPADLVIVTGQATESQLDEEKMDEMNSEFEKEILKVLKAKFDLDPTTATIDFGPNGMSIKPVNYQVWADKFTKGNQGRNGNYVDDKAQKIAAYFNKKYGKNLVAESLDPLDEVINNALKAAGIK